MRTSSTTSDLLNEFLRSCPEATERLEQVAIIKRFVERWLADADLRQAFLERPATVAERYGVPAELQHHLGRPSSWAEASAPGLRVYGRYLEQRATHRQVIRQQCAPSSPAFRVWRERQIKRCRGQLPGHYSQAIMHLPVAFELCQGCSVGCWFCGLSAARLESVFPASEANLRLWRQTLEAVREVAGPAAGRGIAFWATDPLDNPDYELFCQDFHAILGRFPPTTTALGPKDLDRTQALLELSWAKGCEFNRFSILTLKQMDTLTKHFSPEALLYVDLIAQNKGAFKAKALAGKALEKATSPPSAVAAEPSTIACVSGFLINMPARTVRLVSPCRACSRWTEGYRVHASARFADGPELSREMARMIEQGMPVTLPLERPARLRDDLSVSSAGGRVSLGTKFGPARPVNLSEGAIEKLREGRSSPGELALELEASGVPLAETLHILGLLFEEGYLDDEPEVAAHV